MRVPESPFERYMSKRILFFAYDVFLRFWGQSAKETRLWFAIINFSEKLPNIFEIGLKKYEVFIQKLLYWKNISKENTRRHIFVAINVLIYPLSKFGGNRTNSLSFSFLQCPLQVKK